MLTCVDRLHPYDAATSQSIPPEKVGNIQENIVSSPIIRPSAPRPGDFHATLLPANNADRGLSDDTHPVELSSVLTDRRMPSALESEARRLSVSIDDGAPLPPLASASPASPKLMGTIDFVTIMFDAGKQVKDIYVKDRKGATTLVQQFYEDLISVKTDVENLGKVGGDGKYEIRLDLALAHYAMFYLRWVSKPIGEVSKTGITDEQWKAFSELFEFRKNATPGSPEWAFISVDKVLDRLLSPIVSKLSNFPSKSQIIPALLTTVAKNIEKVNVPKEAPVFDGKWITNAPPFLIDKLSVLGPFSWLRTQDKRITINGLNLIYAALKNITTGSLKDQNVITLLGNIGIDKPARYESNEWNQLLNTARTEVDPWQQVGTSMLQSTQQAQSLSDRMYQLLTELARSMFDVDKQFVTS